MRVRKHGFFAALFVAAAALSGTNVAWAQGSVAKAPAPSAVIVPAASASGTSGGGAAEHIFSPPAVLDRAWAHVVRAVLDGVKSLVDAEQIEASEALGRSAAAPGPSAHPPTTQLDPQRLLQKVPPVRAAWSPAHALREAEVQPTPIPIEPPTEVGVDTRGEHAVLLGVKMELPWLLP